MQYLPSISIRIEPKALDLSYTSVCDGLHETACDRLGLDITRPSRRPVTNAGACGTPREMKLRGEFCANMRHLLLSSPMQN